MFGFQGQFRDDVRSAIRKSATVVGPVTDDDLAGLPVPVSRYLHYAGVVGKPGIHNMHLVFDGQMREKGKPWFPFRSEQYNFLDPPARFFFMKAKFKGLPTFGYHSYEDQHARMQVKVAGIIPVVDQKAPQLFPTETVTFLNDLCLFAPAALTDKRIEWEHIDARSAKATFFNKSARISAILSFKETGELINFVSNDRYEVNEMRTYPFSTPVGDFRDLSGYRLPGYGEAVWHYPDGAFTYGRFTVRSLVYNVTELQPDSL